MERVAKPNAEDLVFSLDWLSLNVLLPPDELKPFLKQFIDLDTFEDSGHGGIGVSQLFWGMHCFQLYANPVALKEGDKTYCSLRFPGVCLRAFGMDNLCRFYASLVEDCSIRVNGTRFDVAFDTQGFSVQSTDQHPYA